MKFTRKRGSTGNMIVLFVQDNAATDGSGLTGLSSASSGLKVSVRRELAAALTTYSGANIAAITTLGTWVAPSSGKCNIKKVDDTNAPGMVEVHFLDSVFDASDASRFITGMLLVTGGVPCPFEIELTGTDNQDAVHGGMSALPNTAIVTNASLVTVDDTVEAPANFSAQVIGSDGVVAADAVKIDSDASAAAAQALAAVCVFSGTVTASSDAFTVTCSGLTGITASLKNCVVKWRTGANRYQPASVVAHTPGANHFTVSAASTEGTALTHVPQIGDEFSVF